MDGKERLAVCQARLESKGVRDVKFFFGKTSETPLSEAAEKAATLLETVLAGKSTPMSPIGDARAMKSPA